MALRDVLAAGTFGVTELSALIGEIERSEYRGRLTDVGVCKLRELQVTHHRVARELFLARLSERDLSRFAEIAERALPGVATSPVWAATKEP